MLDPRSWPSSASLAPHAALELGSWRTPTLTAGFAVGWVLTLAALGTFTAIWLVGLVVTTLLWVVGQGKVGPVLVFGATGVLVGRGWVGMVKTIRQRLRKPDLEEPAALPDAFWSLSRELQRVVRHGRSVRIVLSDPELAMADLDREMFEWIASMARLSVADQHFLAERGIVPDSLREELVHSRWSSDRARRSWPGRRPRWRHPDHRAHALSMLERFEHDVLRTGGDPFRGGPGPSRDPTAIVATRARCAGLNGPWQTGRGSLQRQRLDPCEPTPKCPG